MNVTLDSQVIQEEEALKYLVSHVATVGGVEADVQQSFGRE